jgi:hypothetical protein
VFCFQDCGKHGGLFLCGHWEYVEEILRYLEVSFPPPIFGVFVGRA